MDTKPLPCPFCGDEPELYPTDPKREGNAWGEVRCMNPECPTYSTQRDRGVVVRDGEDVADDRGSAKYIEAAIARWNQRR
jgi:hypothetical protein